MYYAAAAVDVMVLDTFYEDSSCTLEVTSAAIRLHFEDFAPAPPPVISSAYTRDRNTHLTRRLRKHCNRVTTTNHGHRRRLDDKSARFEIVKHNIIIIYKVTPYQCHNGFIEHYAHSQHDMSSLINRNNDTECLRGGSEAFNLVKQLQKVNIFYRYHYTVNGYRLSLL